MSKFSCFFFPGNPTNKTETGTAHKWGTTNSKPPRPIIIIDLLEVLSLSPVQFITLVFWGAHPFVAPFTSHAKLHEFGVEKPISGAKLAYFTVFFAINFTVWSHILSTTGDAVRPNMMIKLEWKFGKWLDTRTRRVLFYVINPIPGLAGMFKSRYHTKS
jgi:hypothetical protein